MVDRDVIAAKLADLADRIARVRARCPPDWQGLAADRDARDLVSFNLMLAVQTCLDVASHVIAAEAWPPATSLASAFGRLAEHGVLSSTTTAALAKAAGPRNVVAHGYGGVDLTHVHAAATAGLVDLERFAQEIATWLCRGGPPEPR